MKQSLIEKYCFFSLAVTRSKVRSLQQTPRFTFSNKRKKSVWMNSQALSKVQLKNRAYHQYLRTKDHNDYNIYVKYRNQAKRTCRKAVSDYEHSLSKEVKSNPKAFFAYAKSKLKYASSIPDLKEGSKIITSDEGKATLFNSFFKSVFTKEKIHYQILNQSVRQISVKLFFLKKELKRSCLIWILISHLGQTIYIREY